MEVEKCLKKRIKSIGLSKKMNATVQNTQVRLAFFGVSAHAEEHLLPAISAIPESRLECVVSRDLTKALAIQERFSATRTDSDWRHALLSDDIDAVVAAGPPGFHEEILKACIPLAMPVFVEKPCARNFHEITRLAKYVSSKPEALTFVGFNFRFTLAHKKLVSLAEQLGGVQHLEIEFFTNKPRHPLWDYKDTFESYLYAIAVHPIETALSLIGTPVKVATEFSRVDRHLFDFSVLLTSADGRTALLRLGNTAERFFRRYEITTATNKKISTYTDLPSDVRVRGACLQAATPGHLDGDQIGVLLQPDDLGYKQELRNFVDSVIMGTPSSSSIENSVPVYQIILQLIAARAQIIGSDGFVL